MRWLARLFSPAFVERVVRPAYDDLLLDTAGRPGAADLVRFVASALGAGWPTIVWRRRRPTAAGGVLLAALLLAAAVAFLRITSQYQY